MSRKLFNALSVILVAVFLSSCAGAASGTAKEDGLARITFGNSRAATGDFKSITLTGSYEGGKEKVLGSWKSGSQIAGSTIEIEAGSWKFSLVAALNYEERKATVSKDLEPDTTTSLEFNTTGTGNYIVPANELTLFNCSGSEFSGRNINLTITGVSNSDVQSGTNPIKTFLTRSDIASGCSFCVTLQGSLSVIGNGYSSGSGSGAFTRCSRLSSIVIPSSVTTLESCAFESCTSLSSVNIPSGITTIPTSAFYGCTALASVTIPSSVTTIGASAFQGCSNVNIAFESSGNWKKYSLNSGNLVIAIPAVTKTSSILISDLKTSTDYWKKS